MYSSSLSGASTPKTSGIRHFILMGVWLVVWWFSTCSITKDCARFLKYVCLVTLSSFSQYSTVTFIPIQHYKKYCQWPMSTDTSCGILITYLVDGPYILLTVYVSFGQCMYLVDIHVSCRQYQLLPLCNYKTERAAVASLHHLRRVVHFYVDPSRSFFCWSNVEKRIVTHLVRLQ